MIGVGLWLYDAINNLSPLRQGTALSHGTTIMHIETRLHLDPELALNDWLASHLSLGRLVGDWYDNAHFLVTLGLLGLDLVAPPLPLCLLHPTSSHRHQCGRVRRLLAVPGRPPRMLRCHSGSSTVVAVAHSVGAWSSGALAKGANELRRCRHSMWPGRCGACFAVWIIRRDAISRASIVAYAGATAIIVLATANHISLDVAGGVATAATAWLAAAQWASRRRPLGPWPGSSRRRRRGPGSLTDPPRLA